MWGISETLGVALRETALRKACKITVFLDSQTAIRKLQGSESNAGQALRTQVIKRVKQLQTRSGEVTVRWIPSHSKIEGNEQADKAAKEAAIDGRIQAARWSSLAYINRNITEAMKSEIRSWHQVRSEERESRSQSYYVPRLRPRIHLVLGQAPKKYAVEVQAYG